MFYFVSVCHMKSETSEKNPHPQLLNILLFESSHLCHPPVQLLHLLPRKPTHDSNRPPSPAAVAILVGPTLPWSPWKSCRKLAWVPVVPLTPRKRRSLRARCRFRMSMAKSCSQRHARFPTVVSWAGLRRGASTWGKNKV